MVVPTSPTSIAHYAIQGTLGEGATSVVYLAEHRATGRSVAIKTLRPGLARDPVARARLELEARALGRVHGPHLVDAVDAGVRDDGTPYVVLERLEGVTVAMYVAAGPLPIAATLAIADGVLEALERLHAGGFVHRDVKSSNVVLHKDGGELIPKLIDLGVCIEAQRAVSPGPRLTLQGAWVGTPSYAPPEQVTGSAVDARADVYGAAALVYECLTGDPPHEGRSVAEALTRALSEPVPRVRTRRADCPARLDALLARTLDADPRKRPQTARAMRAELDAIRFQLRLPRGNEALAVLEDPDALRAAAIAARRSSGRPFIAAGGAVATLAVVVAIAAGLDAFDGSLAASPALAWSRAEAVLGTPETDARMVDVERLSPERSAAEPAAAPTDTEPPGLAAPVSVTTLAPVAIEGTVPPDGAPAEAPTEGRARPRARARRPEPETEVPSTMLFAPQDPEPADAGTDPEPVGAPTTPGPQVDPIPEPETWRVEEPGAGVRTPTVWEEHIAPPGGSDTEGDSAGAVMPPSPIEPPAPEAGPPSDEPDM